MTPIEELKERLERLKLSTDTEHTDFHPMKDFVAREQIIKFWVLAEDFKHLAECYREILIKEDEELGMARQRRAFHLFA